MGSGDYFNQYLIPDFEALDAELAGHNWFQNQEEKKEQKEQAEESKRNLVEDEEGRPSSGRSPFDRKKHQESKKDRLQRIKEEYEKRPFISVGTGNSGVWTPESLRQRRRLRKQQLREKLMGEEPKENIAGGTPGFTQMVEYNEPTIMPSTGSIKGFVKRAEATPEIGWSLAAETLELKKGKKYAVPDLPYEYNALEPHIDAETMELHHDKHHKAYVDGLNEGIKDLEKARKKKDADVRAIKDKISFNGSGHVLHSLFWKILSPEGVKEPDKQSAVSKAIYDQYSSFKHFRNEFIATAKSVQGSGWAVLGIMPWVGKLCISPVEKHNHLLIPGVIPILPLDVWEHAYYLQYKNDREAYIEAVFDNLIDWNMVNFLYGVYMPETAE